MARWAGVPMEKLDQPKLSQFGPAIAWLSEKSVSADRLAALFETTPSNIRVVAYRARHESPMALPSPQFPELSRAPQPIRHQELGIRSVRDTFLLTRKITARLDWLEQEIATRFKTHAAQYRYVEGMESLRELRPYVGYPSGARRLGIAAQLHQHIAWLYFQNGFSRSAVREAERAMELLIIARRESGERPKSEVYVRQIVEAAQIASWAFLIAREPERAWRMLDRANDASVANNIPPEPDQFRQRGVALFQLGGRDDDARKLFRQSAELLAHQVETPSETHVLLWESRANLLDPDSDRSAEHLAKIRQAFGPESVEYSGAVSWTAASALVTDSSNAHLAARELLATHSPLSARFGHQATIAKLLAITPELGLYPRLRTVWVRRALYENAFRNR